ncbi:MAG: hypothetical protein QG551_39 [Patescibacteria group bacterium]|jgi:hypothetical protein|nr:hypothetical protein [Patescibacteria group bacterium]MDQ5952811.1 hypothetical protein [Patescibacteria group bacterium]
MNEIDIPIIKKTSDFYKLFHEYRRLIPKQDRHSIYEKAERIIINILEYFLEAGYIKGAGKVVMLEKASVKLNVLRFFIRLMKELKSLDNKKYVALQEMIDEIGRMLGGWIKSSSTMR